MIGGMDTFETVPMLGYLIEEPIQLVCEGLDLR